MSETSQLVDPYLGCNYLIEIGSVITAGFQECSGLESAIDIVEHREGGALTARKIPGVVKYTNLVLKKGLTDDLSLYDWHKRAVQGDIERVNGSVIVLSRGGKEVARWNFYLAWPAKWTGPSFNSENSEIAIETFELAHEGIERA
jgi:phage tail-like protein